MPAYPAARLAVALAVVGVACAFAAPVAADQATAPVVRTDYPAGSPASWLSHEGKSDAWYADTEKCRELLAKLNLNDDRVKRCVAKIKDKAEVLRRAGGFDWKSRTAVEFLQDMLEDLAAGREPLVRYAGKELGYAYWSAAMRRIEAAWVHVPPGYDPAKSYQLFLYYKCGGGIHFKDGKAAGGYRPDAAVANQTDTFHAWSSLDIQIKGRMGGEIELEEFPAALSKDFAVDPDRVFLTGWSDGGFTAIWLGSHFPHLVAGIAPNCGNWQYANVENVGLTNIPVMTVDGWGDGGYNNLQFVRWQALRGWGADVSCVWGHHGHSYQPYEDVEEFKYILDWAKTRKRNPWPKEVRYATWNLSWNRAYWVYLDRLADPALAGRIDVEVKDGNRIEVKTWNLAAYHLALSDKLADPQKNVTVVTDGKQSYAGPYQERIDVELAKRPEAKFVKSAEMPDEITAVTVGCSYSTKGFLAVPGRTWLAVKGTAADEATGKLLEKWWPKDAKADRDVTDADLAGQNLFLYGGPEVNRLTARLAADLPVKFEKGKFTLGPAAYDQPTACIAFLHPNPLNPKKYVIVYAFNDAAAFAKNGYFGMTGESVWKFRSGDAVIAGLPAARPKFGVSVDGAAYETRHVMFGPDWRADRRPAVGEAAKPFDYPQLLRLRADALREAAGADVGIAWSYVPSWNRWGDGMAAGPVTIHGLATQDMLPEYVYIGEMKGADLVRRRGEPAAWSLLADARESGDEAGKTLAVADIQPGKTYRVAFGYHGAPSYGVDYNKMPRLFKWTTPEEFLAGPGTSIPVRNLVQTPLQTTEAVARYVEKRRKIAPRPTYFSLVDYIVNPRDNEYGACDWLHLGMDVSWKRPGGTTAGRYTLNLGVRPAGETPPALPRTSAKHFAELPLDETVAPLAFDFATLQKKLPLAVAAKVRRYALTMASTGKGYALSAGAAEGAVGQAVVVDLTLTNKGQADLAVSAVLADTVMRNVNGQSWPAEAAKEKGWYFGYHRSVGQYQQPPTHQDAALLLVDAAPRKLVAPGAGWNFGLVGMEHAPTVKAGQSLPLPLLFVSIDRPEKGPDINLQAALEAVKAELLRAEGR
jgi:hypothetical protein